MLRTSFSHTQVPPHSPPWSAGLRSSGGCLPADGDPTLSGKALCFAAPHDLAAWDRASSSLSWAFAGLFSPFPPPGPSSLSYSLTVVSSQEPSPHRLPPFLLCLQTGSRHPASCQTKLPSAQSYLQYASTSHLPLSFIRLSLASTLLLICTERKCLS